MTSLLERDEARRGVRRRRRRRRGPRRRLRPELAELVGVVGTLRARPQPHARLAPRPEFTARAARAADDRGRRPALAQRQRPALPPRRKGTASAASRSPPPPSCSSAAPPAWPPRRRTPCPARRSTRSSAASRRPRPPRHRPRRPRARTCSSQADSRLVEVQGAVRQLGGPRAEVAGTLDDFTHQAVEAPSSCSTTTRDDRRPTLIDELRAFTADNLDRLAGARRDGAAPSTRTSSRRRPTLLLTDRRARPPAVPRRAPTPLDSLQMPTLSSPADDAARALDAVGRAGSTTTTRVIADAHEPPPEAASTERPADDDGRPERPRSDGRRRRRLPGTPARPSPATDVPGDRAGHVRTGRRSSRTTSRTPPVRRRRRRSADGAREGAEDVDEAVKTTCTDASTAPSTRGAERHARPTGDLPLTLRARRPAAAVSGRSDFRRISSE